LWCACGWNVVDDFAVALSSKFDECASIGETLFIFAEIRVTRTTIASILLFSERCRTEQTFSLLRLIEKECLL
jgi:hypothetical protein